MNHGLGAHVDELVPECLTGLGWGKGEKQGRAQGDTLKETCPPKSNNEGQERKPLQASVCCCPCHRSASSLAGSLVGSQGTRICFGKGQTGEWVSPGGRDTSTVLNPEVRSPNHVAGSLWALGATSWSQLRAAGQGHRRCLQRTLGSAGHAPTHPSRCCTPAQRLSHC